MTQGLTGMDTRYARREPTSANSTYLGRPWRCLRSACGRSGLPDPRPVDLHLLGQLAVEARQLVVGGQQAEDEELLAPRRLALEAVGDLAVDAEDVLVGRPLDGEDVELVGPALAVLVEVGHPAARRLLPAVLVEPVGEARQAALGVVVAEVLHDVDLGATLLRATGRLAAHRLHPEGRVLAACRLRPDPRRGEAVGEGVRALRADVAVEAERELLAPVGELALTLVRVVQHAER